jgi:hypothetical protein
MIARAFLVLSLVLMLPWMGPGGAYADQFSMSGINFLGSDIRSVDVPRPTGGFASVESICRETCEKDSQCKAWTLVKAGLQGPQAKCWLKSAIPAKRADSCCTSGVPKRALEPGINRIGADYKQVNIKPPMVAGCQHLCQRDGQCEAWTFVKSSGVCWLKSAIPDATTDSCCSSGVADRFIQPN